VGYRVFIGKDGKWSENSPKGPAVAEHVKTRFAANGRGQTWFEYGMGRSRRTGFTSRRYLFGPTPAPSAMRAGPMVARPDYIGSVPSSQAGVPVSKSMHFVWCPKAVDLSAYHAELAGARRPATPRAHPVEQFFGSRLTNVARPARAETGEKKCGRGLACFVFLFFLRPPPETSDRRNPARRHCGGEPSS